MISVLVCDPFVLYYKATRSPFLRMDEQLDTITRNVEGACHLMLSVSVYVEQGY